MMRRLFPVFFLLLLAGCAREQKEAEFIPLKLEWYAYEGAAFVENETPLSPDSAAERANPCMVSLMRELLQNPEIQKSAPEFDFKVQYYVYKSAQDTLLRFLGKNNLPASVSWNKTPILPGETNANTCFWTAECTSKGKINHLKFKADFKIISESRSASEK
ncbi:MAG: hypothetical protein LBR60_00265 [Fibrobacter sp.]|jgi:hypothetical protein|nr:hypothetical protein [Fibrobacter sp.]